MSKVQATVEFQATPEQIAEMFFALDTKEMVRFFEQGAAEVQKWRDKAKAENTFCIPDLMWVQLRKDMRDAAGGPHGDAEEIFMSMAAPFYSYFEEARYR